MCSNGFQIASPISKSLHFPVLFLCFLIISSCLFLSFFLRSVIIVEVPKGSSLATFICIFFFFPFCLSPSLFPSSTCCVFYIESVLIYSSAIIEMKLRRKRCKQKAGKNPKGPTGHNKLLVCILINLLCGVCQTHRQLTELVVDFLFRVTILENWILICILFFSLTLLGGVCQTQTDRLNPWEGPLWSYILIAWNIRVTISSIGLLKNLIVIKTYPFFRLLCCVGYDRRTDILSSFP